MIEVAKKSCGIVAKFTGSGGALVCLAADPSRTSDERRTLRAEEFERTRKIFGQHGFTFEVVEPDVGSSSS